MFWVTTTAHNNGVPCRVSGTLEQTISLSCGTVPDDIRSHLASSSCRAVEMRRSAPLTTSVMPMAAGCIMCEETGATGQWHNTWPSVLGCAYGGSTASLHGGSGPTEDRLEHMQVLQPEYGPLVSACQHRNMPGYMPHEIS
jgi:hypothetical protein